MFVILLYVYVKHVIKINVF